MTVTAVVLAYGPEPLLDQVIGAILASASVEVDVVLVDNGCTSDQVDRARAVRGVRVLTPAENTGYAGGCAAGAAEATGDVLVFVNSDAVVAPEALARLASVAAEPGVGLAMASIRLADRPDRMNTAGNPLHFTGLVWAGGFGEPAADHAVRRSVPVASGCVFAVRRALWEELGGFAPEYFMYNEDTELSLRTHHRGLTVEFVPDAVALHHYTFSRNPGKLYHVERNRLLVLLTAYEFRTLAVLAPMLLATEVALVAAAVRGGWGRRKAAGWAWIWRNRRWVAARRRLLRSERLVPDGAFAHLITARIDPGNVDAPPGTAVFNAVASAYWSLARPLLRRSR